jgi:RimJ/RimL family protein N-acetyltransferase
MNVEQAYIVMPKPRLQDRELTLRAVQPADIEAIRQWRNEQMDVLRQSSLITPEAQQRYFAEYIWPSKASLQPPQILLAIDRHDQLIGYGGLVHIAWAYRRAEISFLLDPKLEHDTPLLTEYFTRFLRLLQTLAFEDLSLQRLTSETYAHRTRHIQALEAAGHRLEGRLESHVLVEGKPCDALVHGLLAAKWRSQNSAAQLPGVLVSSSGGKLPLIRALQAAAKRLPSNARIIGGDSDPLAPSRWEADSFWHMPLLNKEGPDELIQECKTRGIIIVLPTRDGELEFWARHKDAFAQAGIQVIVSSLTSIARCRDKLTFARFGQEAALPIIPAEKSPDAFGPVTLVSKNGSVQARAALACSSCPPLPANTLAYSASRYFSLL